MRHWNRPPQYALQVLSHIYLMCQQGDVVALLEETVDSGRDVLRSAVLQRAVHLRLLRPSDRTQPEQPFLTPLNATVFVTQQDLRQTDRIWKEPTLLARLAAQDASVPIVPTLDVQQSLAESLFDIFINDAEVLSLLLEHAILNPDSGILRALYNRGVPITYACLCLGLYSLLIQLVQRPPFPLSKQVRTRHEEYTSRAAAAALA